MIQSSTYVEDSGLVTTYGISCLTDAEASRSTPSGLEMICDISSQSNLVEKLVEALNEHDADPIHLKELIYDFLP
jgi:hypothetical protein